MNNYWKEIKASGIILLFFGAIGLIFFTISLFENLFYKIVIGYIIVCALTPLIKKANNRFTDKLAEIIFYPFWIIWALAIFIIPFLSLIIHISFYFLFAISIPHFIFKALETFKLCENLSPHNILYLKLTSFVILCVLFNYQIKWLVYNLSPVRMKKSEKLKQFNLETISDYVLDSKNIRFIIYSVYAILLISINVSNFNMVSLYDDLVFDKVVLQSFITFIAFDRALILFKDFDLKPSKLLEIIHKSISNKIKSFDKKET